VLPPLCPLAVSSADFRHADELAARAHRATTDWLQAGGERRPHPERFLSLHTHHPGPVAHATREGHG
jgi:NTE family protein